MNSKKLIINLEALIVLTILIQGCNNGTTDTNSTQTLSYTIPYANNIQTPNTNVLDDPTVNVQLFGESITVPLDTGSRGFLVTQNVLFPESFAPIGTPGSIFYWSSGRRLDGIWVTTDVRYLDAIDSLTGKSVIAVTTVPVLIVQSVTCESGDWPNSCGIPGTTTTTTKPTDEQRMNMGIGFDRTGYQQTPNNDQNNQQYNPLLNLDVMKLGTMRPGYILGLYNVQVGLTQLNTFSGFAFGKLESTGFTQVPGSPPDWQPATGNVSLIINDIETSYPTGEAVIDIGISNMLLTLDNQPTTGQLVDGVIKVNLLGSNGSASYAFNLSEESSQATMPSIVSWAPVQAGVFSQNQIPFANNFVNTGRDVLNCFLYLYDAQDGYVGLKLLTDAPNCEDAHVIPAGINPLWLN